MAQVTTIRINGVDYASYADVETADEYLAADFTATGWQAETDADKKGKALVTATRVLDRAGWAGEKTDEDQLSAWPRTGIADQDEDEVPEAIASATIELARYIYDGSAVLNTSTGLNNIKRQKAGSVEIEYVSPTLLDDPTRYPLPVQELIAPYLGGSGVSAGAISTGTDGCSIANRGFETGWPA